LGTSFVDRKRSALKWLLVEAAYGLVRLSGLGEFDKGKAARSPAFPIRREMDVREGADR